MDPIVLHDGRVMEVHDGELCALEFCVVHNPSDHPLNTAPLNWRGDRQLFERLCPHGVGHPDPDAVAADVMLFAYNPRERGLHGCDGCCNPEMYLSEEDA